MATSITLRDLLEALAGAVIGAQDHIEEHQTASLGQYFDSDNRPQSVLIRLPSLHPGAKDGDEDYYRAPLLSLVPTNPLHIREVEIDFDVQLGEIGEEAVTPAASEQPSQAWQADEPRKTVQIDTRVPQGTQAGAVHVRVKVKSAESTAGMAKLVNHLSQTQGVFKTVKGTESA